MSGGLGSGHVGSPGTSWAPGRSAHTGTCLPCRPDMDASAVEAAFVEMDADVSGHIQPHELDADLGQLKSAYSTHIDA